MGHHRLLHNSLFARWERVPTPTTTSLVNHRHRRSCLYALFTPSHPDFHAHPHTHIGQCTLLASSRGRKNLYRPDCFKRAIIDQYGPLHSHPGGGCPGGLAAGPLGTLPEPSP